MRYLAIFLIIPLFCCSNRNESKKVKPQVVQNIDNSYSVVDSSFDDFIFQFGFNPNFQRARIRFPLDYDNLGVKSFIQQKSWSHDQIFVNLESVTDISNGLKVDEKSIERVFSWINTNSRVSKNYYFKLDWGLWILTQISIFEEPIDTSYEDFYSFLGKFCKDSIFQKQRIKSPLDMTYLNEDYNEVKEKQIAEKWQFSGFYYNCDSIALLYYDFQRTFKNTNKRILKIQGVENGISAQFTFERIDRIWVLTKYEDYST